MSARVLAVAVAVFVVPTAASSQTNSGWTISEMPILSIGSADGDTTLEVHQGNSAARLTNGEIVVASTRNQRLQWYDARGRLIRIIGRRGQGPGEFLGQLLVLADHGDSLLVFDSSTRRWQRFAPNGRFVRVDSTVDSRRVQWMFDRTVVRRLPLGTDLRTLMATLSRMAPVPPDSVRVARVDVRGHVWYRSPTDPASYTVYDAQGRRVGVLRLPGDFELFEIGDSTVLGRWKDADGFEFIQLRRLSRASASPGAPAPQRPTYDQADALRTGAELTALMRATLRRIATVQEVFFSDHVRYAASLAELSRAARVVVPEGMTIAIVGASSRSFALVASHTGTRLSCAVVVDDEAPPRDREVCG